MNEKENNATHERGAEVCLFLNLNFGNVMAYKKDV